MGVDMMIDKDNYVENKSNDYIRLCLYSALGGRDDQQDSTGYLIGEKDCLVVICDGMGGHRGGKLASTLGVQMMLDAFEYIDEKENVQCLFLDTVNETDKRIACLTDEMDEPLRAGTTIVSVYISEKSISWVSVGDSRLYLVRGSEIVQITQDHTCALALKENQAAGLISDSFYEQQSSSADALISFLGADGLPIIDSNVEALNLCSGDRLLLMTDGLYKYVSDDAIFEALERCTVISDAAKALDCEAQRCATRQQIKRDNLTLAIIEIL